MDILSVGFIVYDILVKPITPRVLEVDSTHVDLDTAPGGDGCNVTVNAAALGMKTGLVSAVGADANGDFMKSFFEKHGVDCSGIRTVPDYNTATNIALTEPSGERHFLMSNDIFSQIKPEQITPEMLENTKVISLNSYYRMNCIDGQGIVPIFEKARKNGTLTAVDTVFNHEGDWWGKIEPVLQHTDIFAPSYNEAIHITGEKDVRKMRTKMEQFDMKYFVVKMGSDGSYITDFKKEYMVKPFPVEKVVSTVGAGDSFMAGFLSAQVMEMDMLESSLFASATAAYTVQQMSAVGAVPHKDVVKEFVKNNRHKVEVIDTF